MRFPGTLRLDLSIAAIVAGLGYLTVVTRPRSQQSRGRTMSHTDNLAAWRDELDPSSDRTAARRPKGVDDRGQNATSPTEIPARGWWDIAKRVVTQTISHRLMTEAAGVTFYSLLAIFPGMAALVSIYGLFADPAAVSSEIDQVGSVVPAGGMDILNDQLHRLTTTSGSALSFGAVTGLLIALWSANGGTKALFDALNVVYDEKEKRSYFQLLISTFSLTIGALIAMVIAIAAVVALPIALDYVGLSEAGAIVIRLMRWPLLLVVVSLLLAVIYRYGPSRTRPKWRWVSVGGLFASIMWIVVSIAFSWYVASFQSYNKTYGSLGAVVGFMTWIWISTIVVLVGAELDAEIEHQTAADTTEGPSRPRGMRGATKADEVVRA